MRSAINHLDRQLLPSFLYENRKREGENIFSGGGKDVEKLGREIGGKSKRGDTKRKEEKELERTRVITSCVKRVSNSETNFSLCATEFQWRGEIMV